MQHVLRLTTVLALALAGPLRAEPPDDTSEYKQADTSFYLKSDVLRADPDAVVLTPDAVTDIGGSYLVPARRHPARIVYLQQMHDWIEPITPPSMPASLNIPTNAMQVREPLGNVQVALPGAPADFHSVEEGMTLPNGSVLKTGDNASVAVLFGGVDSVRLAPNSQAAVQMTVTPGRRDAEVDIQDGIVFSKVGQRIGEKESYEVKTPFGTATAHGTDFVTVVLGNRVDVWVAEGTVGLESPIGQKAEASVEGNGAFKVMRFPAAQDEAAARTESAETLTTILNFIPMANQKLEALSDRTRSGAKLTPTEREYIGRIRKIPALIKLARVGAPSEPELAPESAPLSAPQAVVPPLTAITPAPFASPPPQPAPKPTPREKPVTPETPAIKTSPAKPAALEKPVVKTASARTAVVKANESTKRHAKPVVVRAAASPKPSVAKEVVYPRAKPVSAAELTEAAPIVHVTASKPRVAETADPNSLGAPLNSYAPASSNAATGTNAPPAAPDDTPAPSTTTKKTNDTVP